eukprot:9334536-Heterocapsa_arctica.AAC.1
MSSRRPWTRVASLGAAATSSTSWCSHSGPSSIGCSGPKQPKLHSSYTRAEFGLREARKSNPQWISIFV